MSGPFGGAGAGPFGASLPGAATPSTAGLVKIRTDDLVFYATSATAGVAWVNMPSAATEFQGSIVFRVPCDLSNYTQARLYARIVTVAGFAGSLLGLQYSLDSGSTWAYVDGTADGAVGSATPQISCAAVGLIISGWATLATAARADVLLRINGSGGDGAVDPQFVFVRAQFR